MVTSKTFAMIKPDAMEGGKAGAIIEKIYAAGFRISAIRMTLLSVAHAAKFYGVHKERPFFKELVDFITSGPVVVMILEKENAVEDFRNLIGATDPAEATEGTIRKLFAGSKGKNAIHGSDSKENAIVECNFFFSKTERY